MLRRPSSRSGLTLALVLVASAALVGLPAAAKATLAYNTYIESSEVWVSPNEDGTEAGRIGNGSVTQVSPNGELVAYEHEEAFVGWELVIYDVAVGSKNIRLTHMHTTKENVVGEVTAFAWSPDSRMVAVLQNERRSGEQTLYVMPAKGGAEKTRIASGHFRGVSFSPDGKQIVFGLAPNPGRPEETDIARAPVGGGRVTLLTHDHVSGWPLWGPRGQIAFSKRTKTMRRVQGGEVRTRGRFDLFVMRADGGRVKRLTKIRPFEAGFFPAFWLPSGEGLVANYQGLGKNYAALVDPGNGEVVPLSPTSGEAGLGVGEAGFAAVTLSAGGQTVLGCLGSVVFAVPPPASVPLAGGEVTVLDEDAYSPSWSGIPSVGASPC